MPCKKRSYADRIAGDMFLPAGEKKKLLGMAGIPPSQIKRMIKKV